MTKIPNGSGIKRHDNRKKKDIAVRKEDWSQEYGSKEKREVIR
jgi:hypothetical protein